MNSLDYAPNREVQSQYVEEEWQIELQQMYEQQDYSSINNAVSYLLASAPEN